MKRRYVAYSLVFVVVTAILYSVFVESKNTVPAFESAKVERGVVVNTVSVTGHIEPITRVELAFSVGGKLTTLFLKEGDVVSKHTILAELEKGMLESSLIEAEARAMRERALLASVIAPLRTEERALKDVSVKGTEVALMRAEESARTVLAHVYEEIDGAVHEAADELFEDVRSKNPKIGISFGYGSTRYIIQSDDATESSINIQRKKVEDALERMRARKEDANLPIDEALIETQNDLEIVQVFLNTLAQVANRYIAENTDEQTVYESFQTSVASARATVSSMRSEVVSVHGSYSSTVSALSLALKDLELSEAGATRETIEAQEASVASAEAVMETVKKQMSDQTLVSPINGVVSKINFDIGESIGPYEPVVEIITEGVFEVEAYIPEADIARVKLGDVAEMTFDAFDKKEVFKAEVVRIALSETVRDGVPTYKTTLRIIDGERENIILRPGMTANVDIQTDAHENVLFISQRSVIREGERTFVRVFNGTSFEEREVEVSLRGSNGTIEVISGLQEGEEVVIYIEDNT